MAQTITGNMTEVYVSNIDFLHDRDIHKRIFDRYNEEGLIDFLTGTLRSKVAINTNFHWFEKDWVLTNATILSSAGVDAAGETVVITYATTSHQDSGTRSPLKKGDGIMIGKIRGWIQSKDTTTPNAHTITVKPVASTDNIVAVATPGAIVVNPTNGHAEGTGQPDSTLPSPLKFQNQCQIFKTKFEVTGSESTNKTEAGTTKDGKMYYYYEGVDDAFLSHKLHEEFGFLLGHISDASLTDDLEEGKPVRMTRGLDQFITDFGNLDPYATSFDQMKYIDDWAKTLARERAPTENMLLAGVDLDIDIDNLVTSAMREGSIVYNQFGIGDAKKRSVDFSFDSFRKGNYVFHKKRYDALNHKQVTSIPGSTFPKVGYIIPLEKVRDPSTKKQMDTICVRFKQNNEINRDYEHWVRDWKITNKDTLEFNHKSEKGLQMAMLNRTIKVLPA